MRKRAAEVIKTHSTREQTPSLTQTERDHDDKGDLQRLMTVPPSLCMAAVKEQLVRVEGS